MATLNGFYGKGRKKAARRSNAKGGSSRKLYPYPRKEQRGTAVETLINGNYDSLIEQGNAVQLTKNKRMKSSQARGGLKKDWGGAERTLNSMKNIAKYIKKHGGTAGSARKVMVGVSEISFGADPRSK